MKTPLLGPGIVPVPVSGSGVTIVDTGGYFGGGPLTLEEVIALIGAGTAPDSFYLNTLGGKDKIQDLGTIGASETCDLLNASVFLGVMDVDPTIGFTGWTNLRRCTIGLSLTEDGSGGNTPTLTGVTWIGGTPAWDTTAGTTTHVILWSDDGGTTIWGAVVGGGVAALDDLSDVTITSPVEGDDLRYNGSQWVNDPRKWEAVTDGEDVFVWESDDLVHEWSTP